MKKSKVVFTLVATILISSLLLSCKKVDYEPIATDYEVGFAINVSSLKSAFMLKSGVNYNLSEADKIVLTIQNSDGSPTRYTSSDVKIQQMNGIYYTQKIVLKTGNFKLTEFLILDAADSTIFATPLLGSLEAQNVISPLPVSFSVAKDVTTLVNVEVLSTEKKKPEDFGYNRFPIVEVKTFGFLIGVADFQSDKLLAAKLTVSSGAYSYMKNLDSIANNVVNIKDGLTNYTLTVEKSGYIRYTHTYPIDSLKIFKNSTGNLPLLIEIKKELVTDIDGNVYHTVTIGTQVWMVENLKTTKYRNGDAISNVTDNSVWGSLSSGAYCWYNNDAATFKNTYGALYNWYTVVDSRKIAPTGWHVPTQAELITFVNYLGSESIAGGKMKEAGFAHWNSPNTGATNESGFYGLPAGDRTNTFENLGIQTSIWSTTSRVQPWGIGIQLVNNSPNLLWAEFNKYFGFSVRCLKD